jgi:hypothetical protein
MFCVVAELTVPVWVAPSTVNAAPVPAPTGLGADRASTATPTDPGAFVPAAASRIVDSRVGVQVRGPVPGFGAVRVQVTGRAEVPAAVGEVVLTVTAVGPRASGYLQVWPTGAARPATSKLNFPAGQDISTTLVVPVGAGGRIEVFNASAADGDVLVDVTGYLIGSPTAPGFAHPGILVGTEQLDFVRARINAGAETWKTALANATKVKAGSGRNAGVVYSSPSWTPRHAPSLAAVPIGTPTRDVPTNSTTASPPTPRHYRGTTPATLTNARGDRDHERLVVQPHRPPLGRDLQRRSLAGRMGRPPRWTLWVSPRCSTVLTFRTSSTGGTEVDRTG